MTSSETASSRSYSVPQNDAAVPTSPELVADTRCEIAEGPPWHLDEQRLYWTDIPARHLFRYDPANGSGELVYDGEPIGGMALQEDGSLVLLGLNASVRLWKDGTVTDTILSEIPDERQSRFNDFDVDPEGQLYRSTMALRDQARHLLRHGSLYYFERGRLLHPVLTGLDSPNGMAITPDLRHLYVPDSFLGTQAFFRFNYEPATGALRNRRLFHQTQQNGPDGRPDRLAINEDGFLWSARWEGGAIVRLRPDGTEADRITFPVSRVTSVTFGGHDLTDLYVTNAQDDSGGPAQHGADGVFRVRGVTRGRPAFRARLSIPMTGDCSS